ncbi:MAG: rhomboid family intramembrane serine protease [Acidimicrobiia bacterium]|nr:rhomboid family intramembrane serine protease [Acidimicrobiia bacterium]
MLPIRDVNPTLIRPLVTWAIIALNVVVIALIQPQESPAADEFAYRTAAIACELTTGDPLEYFEINSGACIERDGGDAPFPGKNVWLAVVWSMFLHAGFAHILFNMWSMWIFGNNVEEAFGHIGFAIFYVAAGIVATLGFVVLQPSTTVPLVGASGAIAGVMGAYLVLFPRHLVLTLIFIRAVAIPAVAFLVIWFFSQFLFAGGDSGIAWEAHVAGFLFGVAVTLPMRERLLARIGSPSADMI